ncbi:MAG: polyprenyl synthetase family protein [Eubacteriales bacterium]|nr:polyprenyl synthetase family protein [Eubacteriales bacterium]
MSDFDCRYDAYRHRAEDALRKHLSKAGEPWQDDQIPSMLAEAMRYSLFAGGKRLRPVMLLAAFGMPEEPLNDALPFAAAIEMIHTYSLIHDDLPAMDNDDMRRGKKTSHKIFGEGMAILAGDALLNRAFELMAESSAERAQLAMAEIARLAGPRGMIGGQAADLAMENSAPDMNMVRYIQRHKTSDLFIAAIKAGSILAGKDEYAITAAEQYALHYGLAFQITDDLLDIEGFQGVFGKSTGKDAKAGKMTWPAVAGVAQARRDAEKETALALEASAALGNSADFFAALAQMVLGRVK